MEFYSEGVIIFWDETKIYIEAGKGGDGLVSFRHEKFQPRGGPDGGDGGRGGGIYFEVDPNLNTLINFNRLKKFKAEDGEKGKKAKQKGKDGEDLILKIPRGSIIYQLENENDKVGEKILDIMQESKFIEFAKGGNGGWGNVHFTTSTTQAPTRANPGKPGEAFWLKIEIKLIADVAIIGLPNSGKSTLLSRISNARPKIADYPFTTLVPNLGVAQVDSKSIVFCDIPGLIEGANLGKGLGDKFLRHIERCKIIVHLIDINSQNVVTDYAKIRKELELYSPILLSKKEIIALTKTDSASEKIIKTVVKKLKNKTKSPIVPISSVSGKNIEKLLFTIKKFI